MQLRDCEFQSDGSKSISGREAFEFGGFSAGTMTVALEWTRFCT